jgi:hypothetical protein
MVGNGGGYKSLVLHLNQNQSLAWITGKFPGADKQYYVVVLDLVNFEIVDGNMLEKQQNPSGLKRELEQASTTATVIEEQK